MLNCQPRCQTCIWWRPSPVNRAQGLCSLAARDYCPSAALPTQCETVIRAWFPDWEHSEPRLGSDSCALHSAELFSDRTLGLLWILKALGVKEDYELPRTPRIKEQIKRWNKENPHVLGGDPFDLI
jgi:hypothetical protein